MKEFIRVVKFTLFSLSAGLIEIGAFTLLNEILHLDYWVSYLIALVLSVVWNFTLNRKYTFKSATNIPIAMLKVALFYAVFTPLSTWLEHWYTTGLGWNEYVATILNMLLNFVTEFLYQRFFVFGKSLDTNAAAAEEKSGEDAVAETAETVSAVEAVADVAAETVTNNKES
ncbi:MAG: GtrA family protein [Firmicutes bacterium]|nr:GtrA family protein [Bacillota bacterium]